MNSPVDRFKKRHAALKDKTFLNVGVNQSFPDIDIGDAAKSYISETLENRSESIALEANMLLKDIQGAINSEKFSALIDSCQENCLQTIIRPFGVGKVLFKDMLGGNVVTTHNVRSKDYVDSEETAYSKSGEKDKYNNSVAKFEEDKKKYAEYRKAFNNGETNIPKVKNPKEPYRNGNQNYGKARDDAQNAQNEGTLENKIANGNFSSTANIEIDHTVSIEEIEKMPDRLLAEVNGADLANAESNLNPMERAINRSKNDKTYKDFAKHIEDKKIPELEKEIQILEERKSTSGLSGEEEERLENTKKNLEKFKKLDKEKMQSLDKNARSEMQRKIDIAYYTSNKFIKNTISTSLNEGKKMAAQQAIGVLMEEFVRAAFAEVKDIWQNGFKGSVDDSFLAILKERLMHVAMRVQSKWRDSASAGLSGAISGFMSNIVTVMINIFATTAKRVGRMLREGSMSLYGAFKILAFPKEGMTLAQAADAAFKLLAAGIITSLGIELEMILQGYLTAIVPLAPFSTYISGIGAGLITGVTTAFVTYMIDYLDFFGVNAKSRHEQVVAKLDDMIAISYEQAEKSAALFIAPPSVA